jgi:uncharacterized membrane protein
VVAVNKPAQVALVTPHQHRQAKAITVEILVLVHLELAAAVVLAARGATALLVWQAQQVMGVLVWPRP